MNDTYQLYDEQGRPLAGDEYVSREEIFKSGKLHGASHVWIWRIQNGELEVLLQKRSPQKWTWPNCYDTSAAGHIDAGEEPLAAAMRETEEELGIHPDVEKIHCIGVNRSRTVTPAGLVENEFQWLYALRLDGDTTFTIQDSEVASLLWKPVRRIEQELRDTPDTYVPHGSVYFETIFTALKKAAAV